MFGRFLPKETSFFDFFEQHAALTVEGTKEFLSLVTTGANIETKAKRVSDIEHETDVITHRCVEALHKTFITPIDRDNIHRLITRMDDVMDFVDPRPRTGIGDDAAVSDEDVGDDTVAAVGRIDHRAAGEPAHRHRVPPAAPSAASIMASAAPAEGAVVARSAASWNATTRSVRKT